MRVITGTAKGRKLVAPQGLSTRPTSDMAKEAIFSIIQFEVEGSLVLDLFAGSGQLAIEALSRGARGAVLVDVSREAQRAITENLEKTGFRDKARVISSQAETFVNSSRDTFDIAFLDPPYHQNLIPAVLKELSKRMNGGGIIICETQRDEKLPDTAGDFALCRQYRYGKIMLTTYRRLEEAEK